MSECIINGKPTTWYYMCVGPDEDFKGTSYCFIEETSTNGTIFNMWVTEVILSWSGLGIKLKSAGYKSTNRIINDKSFLNKYWDTYRLPKNIFKKIHKHMIFSVKDQIILKEKQTVPDYSNITKHEFDELYSIDKFKRNIIGRVK